MKLFHAAKESTPQETPKNVSELVYFQNVSKNRSFVLCFSLQFVKNNAHVRVARLSSLEA